VSVNGQRALEYVRNWNKVFPPGTVVEHQGSKRKTWSPAGMGPKGTPSVWLEGVEDLVPLDVLTVPGWERKRR